MVACTGSKAHLRKLATACGPLRSLKSKHYESESALYRQHALQYIEPELREGHDEVERAKAGTLPNLVTISDIRGDLHAHSTSSDGLILIEDMAEASRARHYEYIGISDHSQSLKIAAAFRSRICGRRSNTLTSSTGATRLPILKSSEVDILADGSSGLPGSPFRGTRLYRLLHSFPFCIGREAQNTQRLLRAMDNRYFIYPGHATGRLLLKRPGYEIDVDRVVDTRARERVFSRDQFQPRPLGTSACGKCRGQQRRRAS